MTFKGFKKSQILEAGKGDLGNLMAAKRQKVTGESFHVFSFLFVASFFLPRGHQNLCHLRS